MSISQRRKINRNAHANEIYAEYKLEKRELTAF